MSSPGQKRGSCGHSMAGFDGHSFCARCREKGKGEEPCIANKDTTDCKFCNLFTPEQRAQISTPSYKIKNEKQEAKLVDNPTRTEDIALVDPASVSVIGAVGGAASSQSPSLPPEKKPKKDKAPTKPKKSASSALDAKWSEWFNRLEALLMAKSLEPSFSADVRVTPVHSPPANVSKDSEPFFQPPHRPVDSGSQRTGPDSDAALQPLACLQILFLKINQLLRALAQTLLLPSNSRPVSKSRITTPGLHQSALVQTSLLVSISRPASHTPTFTDLHRPAALSV